jgi:hypothetical protein
MYNIGGDYNQGSIISIAWAGSTAGGESMQPENMIWIAAGKRYSTETATLIAHDVYWNGHRFEQNGRNTFLFRTPSGSFFAQHQTLVPGEINRIAPLEQNEALQLYQSLHKKEVPFRIAFPHIKAEDA